MSLWGAFSRQSDLSLCQVPVMDEGTDHQMIWMQVRASQDLSTILEDLMQVARVSTGARSHLVRGLDRESIRSYRMGPLNKVIIWGGNLKDLLRAIEALVGKSRAPPGIWESHKVHLISREPCLQVRKEAFSIREMLMTLSHRKFQIHLQGKVLLALEVMQSLILWVLHRSSLNRKELPLILWDLVIQSHKEVDFSQSLKSRNHLEVFLASKPRKPLKPKLLGMTWLIWWISHHLSQNQKVSSLASPRQPNKYPNLTMEVGETTTASGTLMMTLEQTKKALTSKVKNTKIQI